MSITGSLDIPPEAAAAPNDFFLYSDLEEDDETGDMLVAITAIERSGSPSLEDATAQWRAIQSLSDTALRVTDAQRNLLRRIIEADPILAKNGNRDRLLQMIANLPAVPAMPPPMPENLDNAPVLRQFMNAPHHYDPCVVTNTETGASFLAITPHIERRPLMRQGVIPPYTISYQPSSVIRHASLLPANTLLLVYHRLDSCIRNASPPVDEAEQSEFYSLSALVKGLATSSTTLHDLPRIPRGGGEPFGPREQPAATPQAPLDLRMNQYLIEQVTGAYYALSLNVPDDLAEVCREAHAKACRLFGIRAPSPIALTSIEAFEATTPFPGLRVYMDAFTRWHKEQGDPRKKLTDWLRLIQASPGAPPISFGFLPDNPFAGRTLAARIEASTPQKLAAQLRSCYKAYQEALAGLHLHHPGERFNARFSAPEQRAFLDQVRAGFAQRFPGCPVPPDLGERLHAISMDLARELSRKQSE